MEQPTRKVTDGDEKSTSRMRSLTVASSTSLVIPAARTHTQDITKGSMASFVLRSTPPCTNAVSPSSRSSQSGRSTMYRIPAVSIAP
eukprot:scaffold55523_cov32-Tisochrysis_lutea.AAC.1